MAKKEHATVRHSIDAAAPAQLTASQRKELAALQLKPDSAIDYSDAAELPDAAAWERPEALTPPPKQHLSLRLDADLIAFFRATGPRYQSRINAVLRAYVERHSKR